MMEHEEHITFSSGHFLSEMLPEDWHENWPENWPETGLIWQKGSP